LQISITDFDKNPKIWRYSRFCYEILITMVACEKAGLHLVEKIDIFRVG